MRVPDLDRLVDEIMAETGWGPYEVFDLPLWRARNIAKQARRRRLATIAGLLAAVRDNPPRPAGACWPPVTEPDRP